MASINIIMRNEVEDDSDDVKNDSSVLLWRSPDSKILATIHTVIDYLEIPSIAKTVVDLKMMRR